MRGGESQGLPLPVSCGRPKRSERGAKRILTPDDNLVGCSYREKAVEKTMR